MGGGGGGGVYFRYVTVVLNVLFLMFSFNGVGQGNTSGMLHIKKGTSYIVLKYSSMCFLLKVGGINC